MKSNSLEIPSTKLEIRGGRYAEKSDPSFVKIVEEVLPFMDYDEAIKFYTEFVPSLKSDELAFLGCRDRFFLLTSLLNRGDAIHPWLYDRCREVEARPDGHLDLWARGHYKSTVITFAGTIQEVLCDPELRIGIFSNTKDISKPFVFQIKEELEGNEFLKEIYQDVLWENPRKDAPKWSVDDGLTIRRESNPKEATWEAHGIIDAMPTGRHFPLLVFDDVITEKNVTNPDQIQKATERVELADNLGNVVGLTRKWFIGTRYSFADTYGILLEHEIAVPRLYPATDNGRIDGNPVMLTQEQWDERVRSQRTTLAAQMLQNPLAGQENTFNATWLAGYLIRPHLMNVYIVVDPSQGRNATSDRTAMAVLGIDPAGNKYLLDGYCHRMGLSERWRNLRGLHKKWSGMSGVRRITVGYERYGLQGDLEYFEEKMRAEQRVFEVEEVSWISERGKESKTHRVARMEPDFRNESFFVPGRVWHPAHGVCTWRVDEESEEIILSKDKGRTSREKQVASSGESWRIVTPIKRKNEDGDLYDLTRVFFEEFRFFPFSPRDDLVDAMNRIYDLEPTEPVYLENYEDIYDEDYYDD